MAIEATGGGIMITGEHIGLHRELSTAHALALEVNTTMRHSRGSVMVAANRITGQLDTDRVNAAAKAAGVRYRIPRDFGTKRTKRGALVDLVTYLMIVWGWEPLPSMVKALDKDAESTMKRARAIRDAALRVEGGK